MVAFIGVNMIIVQLVSDIWGADYKPLAMPLKSFHLKVGAVDITYPWYYILTTVVCAVLVVAMYLLFTKTDLGIRSLACIQNKDMSRCLGVNSLRLGLFVFALGMALASLGGSLAAPIFSVHPGMGDQLLIFLFIIVIVGGVGSIAGSLVAGLGISILKALVSIWLPGNVATILTLAVLVVFLLWKPRGLMGVEEVLE
jgi:branched-chain amino acid transport system permease protein